VKCNCSTVHKTKADKLNKKRFGKGDDYDFRSCECRVKDKRLSKHGVDNTQVSIEVSGRKGFETDV